MSETPLEQEQTEELVEATTPPEEIEATREGEAPQPVTQGDLRPDADEHPVDTTPPQSQDQPNTGREPGDPHEPMNKADERGEPNARRHGGGDGTVQES